MGQLIKLQDYTSRYEQNIYHYPARFVTLKKQQWEKIQKRWENPYEETLAPSIAQSLEVEEQDDSKHSLLGKIKTLFHRNHHDVVIEENDHPPKSMIEEELSRFDEIYNSTTRSATKEELKRRFLNQLFQFQMTWATSTLVDKSFINKGFHYDEKLKYFLQRFPDTYLVLYRPIFQLKKATIEVETILVSPTDIWCIHFVENGDGAVFIGNNEKFWTLRNKQQEKKVVNPMIGLNRMGKIVVNILEISDVQMPIHKVLLSRNGFIDYPIPPFDVELIDKRNYDEWFQNLRGLRSPLKATQLKGAEALLRYCLTSSVKRTEWKVWDKK